MKSDHPVITLLGNNSGRNLGDAAILSAIMDVLQKEMPDSEFLVPSIAPKFIDKNYGEKYNAKGVNVLPWTGSIRLLGLPTFYSLWKSDAALICDGIIFGKGLLNPAFNFLITLIFLVPFAKLVGCKMICFNCGIGPFPSALSRACARWVMNGSDLVTLRDQASVDLAREIGITVPMIVAGDSAFLNPVSSHDRAKEIAAENGFSFTEKPLFGLNVTSYMNSWLKPEERSTDGTALIHMIVQSVKQASETHNFTPVVFSTQPMDEKLSQQVAQDLNCPIIDNTRYLSHDIQAVMREIDLLMGMRFHSLVLTAAVDTPVIGLIYAPKVRGYMELMDCKEYGIEFAGLTEEHLLDRITSAWTNRTQLKEKQNRFTQELRKGAYQTAQQLTELIQNNTISQTTTNQYSSANESA